MKLTSAQAAKKLRKLNEHLTYLLDMEDSASEFIAAVSEDLEAARPEYDYEATQRQIAETEDKIRALKHAINVFNSTHRIAGYDMTVDEMLVYIPQLTRRKKRLSAMGATLPKERVENRYASSVIEYSYANYDTRKAAADAAAVSEELFAAQNALDRFNSTETFEFEF